MYKKILVFLMLTLLAAGSLFFNLQHQTLQAAEVGTEVGLEAPNFTLKDINNKELKLSDYRGRKVFLNFWASWCPPCRMEMPDMQKLHEKYGEELVILAVNIGESKATALNYMMENKLNFKVLLDQNKNTAQKYLVRGVPTSYFLDQEGIIKNKVVGAVSYEKMLELSGIEN